MYIVNPICGCILSQHALEDCTIKFESNSFRILLSAGYNSFQVFDAVEDAGEVSSMPSKSEGNIILLTEQALPLSEASLSRQQVFGTSCVLALADSTLCCCINWILQITAVLFCHER